MEPIQIFIIHDDLPENDPLIISLKEKYGESNVRLEKKSSRGLEYIHNNLSSKLIVLLDFDLGQGEPHAPEIIEKIRQDTSLIYVIIVTAKQFSEISSYDLVKFINNEALAIIQNTADTSEIVALVDKAAHELDSRVDCVLEQWIAKRPKEEKLKPYLTTRSGKVYTLDNLIVEIRKETEIGKRLEKGILQLAIEQLTKEGKQLDD